MLSMTNLRSELGAEPPLRCVDCAMGGLEGGEQPPFMGSKVVPQEIFFGPYIGLGRPTYGFRSMVLDTMVFGPWYWMLRHV